MILPMTVIRRLDCVLEPTKNKVLAVREQYGDRDTLLRSAAGVDFYNTSKLTRRASSKTRPTSPASCGRTWLPSPRTPAT